MSFTTFKGSTMKVLALRLFTALVVLGEFMLDVLFGEEEMTPKQQSSFNELIKLINDKSVSDVHVRECIEVYLTTHDPQRHLFSTIKLLRNVRWLRRGALPRSNL